MNQVERFRRLSVWDDWPECFCCHERVETGWTFYPEDTPTISVCDGCLSKAKKSYIGFCVDGKERSKDG